MRLKRLVASLGMMIILASSMTAQANGVVEIDASDIDGVYGQEVESNSWENWAEGPHIYSESGIVMDMDSGAVLYAKNIHDRHYPASITKVMTALVALQSYEMDEIVTFTWDDIGFLEYGDAHIGIKPDEEVVMEDCMYGMLLASANEVSHAIGSHYTGGYDAFLAEMNRVSAEIGCQNSHWMNTHGLHDEQHYTSVYDMALIGSEVFKYDKFREITFSHTHVIPETNITDETRAFQQNHKMIWDWHEYYYEYCVGGKTGYTDQALTTLVTFATKDNMNLVAVVMRTHGGGVNAYADTESMLDYAFENFATMEVSQSMVSDVNVDSIQDDAYVTVPNSASMAQLECTAEYPAEVGEMNGTLSYTYGGQPMGTVEMTVTEEYYNTIHPEEVEEAEDVQEEVVEEPKETKMGTGLKICIIVVAIIVVLILGLCIYVSIRRKQLEKRRRELRAQAKRDMEAFLGK